MSFEDKDYSMGAKYECWGDAGSFGVKIMLAGDAVDIAFNQKAERMLSRQAEEIFKGLAAAKIAADPKTAEKVAATCAQLLECFSGQEIFVEPIQNEYCKDWCCRHKRSYIVVTRKGPIKIGWRKSVISIDWSNSQILATADALFPTENVTKDGRLIHAWGYDKAHEYVTRLLDPQTTPEVSESFAGGKTE